MCASVIQPLGAASLPGELTSLQNSRYRCTVKIPIQGTENIPSPKMLALGSAYSDIYSVDTDESAYANLRLVSQQVGSDTVNRAQAILLTQVYETLTGTFVGEVDDRTDFDLNGLKRITRTLIAVAGTSTAAFVVGTQTYSSSPTLYLAKVNIEENDAFVRVTAEYLQPGVVARTIRQLDGGLREETIQSFYTRTAPTGIVVYDREENEDGYPVFTVTAMQNKSGGDPTSGTAVSVATFENFTYPGRAKPYSVTWFSWTFIDVFLSPPVTIPIDATVEITYTTTASIGTLANALWAPDEWAYIEAYWNPFGYGYSSKIEALNGYRSVSSTAVTVTAGNPTDASCLGQALTFSTQARLRAIGGPANPDGNTYTLRYDVSPAFVSSTGTQYYRRTVVYATIPTQTDSLPV